MTFLVLEKFKNIKGSLPTNVLNLGSKLASYVLSRPQEQKSQGLPEQDQLFVCDRDQLAKIPAVQLQSQQYTRMCYIQEQLIKEISSREEQKLLKRQQQLQKELDSLIQQSQKQAIQAKKQQIYDKLNKGQLQLRRIIQENVILKQMIYEAGK